MRDKRRISKFCNELSTIWASNAPDWRFGQLMMNVLVEMVSDGKDPFFPEEEEMIEYFKKYFEQDTEK